MNATSTDSILIDWSTLTVYNISHTTLEFYNETTWIDIVTTGSSVKVSSHMKTVNCVLAGIMMGIIITSITGSTLVLTAIARTKHLQRLNNLLIVSLSAGDIGVSVFCMPLYTAKLIASNWALPYGLCVFYFCMKIAFMSVSSLHLTAIALERFFVIVKPLHYQKYANWKLLAAVIISIWCASFIYGCLQTVWFFTPANVKFFSSNPKVCQYNPSFGYIIFDNIVTFVIPLSVMFYCYARIFCVARWQLKEIKHQCPSRDIDTEGCSSNSQASVFDEPNTVNEFSEPETNKTAGVGNEKMIKSKHTIFTKLGNRTAINTITDSETEIKSKPSIVQNGDVQDHAMTEHSTTDSGIDSVPVIASNTSTTREASSCISHDDDSKTVSKDKTTCDYKIKSEKGIIKELLKGPTQQKLSFQPTSFTAQRKRFSYPLIAEIPQLETLRTSPTWPRLQSETNNNRTTEPVSKTNVAKPKITRLPRRNTTYTDKVRAWLTREQFIDKDSRIETDVPKIVVDESHCSDPEYLEMKVIREGVECHYSDDEISNIDTRAGIEPDNNCKIENQSKVKSGGILHTCTHVNSKQKRHSVVSFNIPPSPTSQSFVTSNAKECEPSNKNIISNQNHASKEYLSVQSKEHHRRRPNSSSSYTGSDFSQALSKRLRQLRQQIRENKAAKMTAMVLGAFVVCWLPYEVGTIIKKVCKSCMPTLVWNCCVVFAYMNSAINPFIYNFYSCEFRKATKKALNCGKNKIHPLTR